MATQTTNTNSSENLYNITNDNEENNTELDKTITEENTKYNEQHNEQYNDQMEEIDEIINPNIEWLPYDIDTDIHNEMVSNEYHTLKNKGLWGYAKMIITNNNKDTIAFTEYFLDYFEPYLTKNNDAFENIKKVYYKSYLDTDIIYNFNNTSIAKYIIENIKIPSFKPFGYFTTPNETQNKWPYTISIITDRGVYTFNRYISESRIAFY